MKAVLYIVILEYSLYSKLSCCMRFIQLRSFAAVLAKSAFRLPVYFLVARSSSGTRITELLARKQAAGLFALFIIIG